MTRWERYLGTVTWGTVTRGSGGPLFVIISQHCHGSFSHVRLIRAGPQVPPGAPPHYYVRDMADNASHLASPGRGQSFARLSPDKLQILSRQTAQWGQAPETNCTMRTGLRRVSALSWGSWLPTGSGEGMKCCIVLVSLSHSQYRSCFNG